MDSRDIPFRAALRDEIDRLITTTLPLYDNEDLKRMSEFQYLKIVHRVDALSAGAGT